MALSMMLDIILCIRPHVKANDVVKQQIGESERIKIIHLIREASI